MPRALRKVAAGGLYHVLNRGNGQMTLFHKPADYDAFVKVLAEALQRYEVDLLAWCLMPNHWHLVLRPRHGAALAGLMHWIGVTHVRRHHQHHHTRGGGHLYQGRFKSFPIQDDRHFRTVCRYVESNALRAKLCRRAEGWPWTSAARQDVPQRRLPIGAWPVDRPRNWVELLNEPMKMSQMQQIRTSIERGRPLGDEMWVAATAKRLGLTQSLRGIGRPRKTEQKKARKGNK